MQIHSGFEISLRAGFPKGTKSAVCVLAFILAMATAKDVHLDAVLKGNAEFTKTLYQALSKEKGNVFFSPISVHAVLSMVHQGAKGKTQQALTNVLKVPGPEESADGYERVMKSLNSVKNVTLSIANKVFLKNKYVFKASYAATIAKNFQSEVESVDFEKKEEAAKIINTWVENKTNNRIKDLVNADMFDELTRLVLVNAIYFKGKWSHPFPVAQTQTEKFYINDDEIMDVQMMHLTKNLFYKEDETLDAKVLELPYSNKELSMIIILPNKRNGIHELEKKLATVDLSTITENMYKPEVKVSLPKFKIETDVMDLTQPLKDAGLEQIFTDEADFSGMLDNPERLAVSQVVQKAFIEVGEEGTEAAAASGDLEMVPMSAIIAPPKIVNVDHPFILLLESRGAGERNILFQGRVLQPAQ
ncbi:unnamed protein product [Acanthoscelides obtectus]|uniref:Serpin domain-containing protein n=2 Tax=Acanthoscelides obtectus TaxID=200917 RepID=A0A9P0Q802_ACAOB|nr:unnamed protein product [Acanthoscelides obtectus]CAK1642436.1 Serpin I2 [Acanthoscelides obtectus]